MIVTVIVIIVIVAFVAGAVYFHDYIKKRMK